MNCPECRRLLAVDPQRIDAVHRQHLDGCAECTQILRCGQNFEQRLAYALAVEVPAGFEQGLLRAVRSEFKRTGAGTAQVPLQMPRKPRWVPALAMAAVMLLTFAASVGVWRYHDNHSLPAYAVAHILGAEFAAMKLDQPISNQAVVAGFADRQTSLYGPIPSDVTYVNDCIVGLSQRAVHLVMRKGNEPVTVLYLPGQRNSRRDFRRDGWYGREVPTEHGTMVILASNPVLFDAVQLAWQTAIDGVVATTASVP